MKRILAVLDKERSYAEELAACANERELTPFSVIAFSSLENLKNFTLRQPVELLLSGIDVSPEDLRDIKAAQVIRLMEGGHHLTEQGRNGRGDAEYRYSVICKYQSADRLFREVMECYKSREGSFSDDDLKGEIIGVCSPTGRCGKTGFAVTLGQVLSQSCKVMYLNFEECSGLSALTGTAYKRTLSDLIYAQRQGNLDESVIGSATYQLGRLDYAAPVSCAEDMAEIKAEELAALTERLAQCGHYEVIILDVGDLGKDAFVLLERCGIIYAPVADDVVSAAKTAEWQRQILSYGGDELLERVKFLKLPLPDPADAPEGYFDGLLYGEVGRKVRELLGGEEAVSGM